MGQLLGFLSKYPLRQNSVGFLESGLIAQHMKADMLQIREKQREQKIVVQFCIFPLFFRTRRTKKNDWTTGSQSPKVDLKVETQEG